MDCYVAEDGRSFVSKRGLLRALRGIESAEDSLEPNSTKAENNSSVSGKLHLKNAGNSSDPNRGDLDRYTARLPANLLAKSSDPTFEITLPTGGFADAISEVRATEIISAYVEAGIGGLLRKDQRHLGQSAYRMQRAMAAVGLRALIHEASGYIADRRLRDIADHVDRMLSLAVRSWDLAHYPKLVDKLARLYGERYESGRHPVCLRRINGQLMEIFLSTEIYRELKRRHPGEHVNNHQLLTDTARTSYAEFLRVVEVVAEFATSPDELRAKLRHRYQREPYQLPLAASSKRRRPVRVLKTTTVTTSELYVDPRQLMIPGAS